MHIFNLKYDEVLNMPATLYAELGGQAVNIGAFLATGELKTTTAREDVDKLRAQYKEIKERGLI